MSRSSTGKAARLWPEKADGATVRIGLRTVQLTHLQKVFFPQTGSTKGDLLQYYAEIAPYLLPHVKDRAMVMKRYPHGAEGEFFFMKRVPEPHPEWLETCGIDHGSNGVIDFPMVQDLASLLWIINLGCIDLNPWYGRCAQYNNPDYLHFDLDPMPKVPFAQVRECALLIHQALDALKMPNIAKTTGSKGIHVYIPIVRGPDQKQVWGVAKEMAFTIARQYPKLMTAEYRIEKRPVGRVLVDYNQNAWGRTLASVYSVRPKPKASVSMPVTWKEIENDVEIEDFRLDNARARLQKRGDLWAPVDEPQRRFNLGKFL